MSVEDNSQDLPSEEAEQVKPAAQSGKQEQEKPVTKKQKFWQFVKFALFSASAGAIQLLSTTTLHQWTGWLIDYYWIAYVIGLTLSVIWNFTFNRKFTFKASSNVPIAMVLVVIYNLIIVVPLAYGGQKLEELWGPDLGIVVTVISLLINFITEFFWDKFIVFNDKVINKIEKKFSKKKKSAVTEAAATTEQTESDQPDKTE
ncbi:MAG: GtrA family protein [Clostridia bacterium]|nr:GtrA family protein [Clostridia bacterium]